MANELDFDELDKAVNSLMGNVTEKDAAPKSKTLDINTTLAPDEAPTYKHLDEAAQKIGNETIDRQEQTVSLNEEEIEKLPPMQSPPKKASGRFMDVVHPSSDMRTVASIKNVSREGVTIAPKEAPSQEPATDAVLTKSQTPLHVEEQEKPKDNLASEAKPEPSEPLVSPFLPDAKVEKRPLGGLEPKQEAETEEASKITESLSAPVSLEEKKPLLLEEPEQATQTDNLPPLTELEPKVDDTADEKVESNPEEVLEKKNDDEFSKMDAMDQAAKSLNEVTEHIPEEFKNELLEVEKVTTSISDSGPIGIVSIPKQYQEKESTGDKTNGSIYDTDHYHKPVAHPAQQKSGWMWVIVVIILIAIGAALGATAYFFGLV